MVVQRVAVIGAGPSGLTSVKACLDEGLEPMCFESSHDIGGLWRYKVREDKPEPGRANVYQSVVINSSKEMMAFSDFPPLPELPNNMHHTEVLKYLRLYAHKFNLLPYIYFQTTVTSVTQAADFTGTGRWIVETETVDSQRATHVFDAVLVCTGHFSVPHLPLKDFPGIESFPGRYFHSWDYCNPTGLEDKTVVVIGFGNSGSDLAVDISRVANRVYLSTRTGAWVTCRVGPKGIPADIAWITRTGALMQKLFPSWSNRMFEKKMNEMYDHQLYGLKPNFLAQIPVVNDNLASQIISGRVRMKPNIKEFRESNVIFTDGSICVLHVDVVVFATGYKHSFPFLQLRSAYMLHLYRNVFPAALSPPTLAVVGFISGAGSINPAAELQARWATRIFKGLVSLPKQEDMMKAIEKEPGMFSGSGHNSLQVDFIPYMDSLAHEIGVHPNVLTLCLKDPILALEVFTGPCTSYQYRLTGPGRWSGSRNAILTQMDRVREPFRTRMVPGPETSSLSQQNVIMFFGCTALLCWFFCNMYIRPVFPLW
uniref:Flavin-containing monooxygenase n=1 Tax=Gouania willdenowi TaxID=441366 RepID=A0A8C5FYV3_GOUWI